MAGTLIVSNLKTDTDNSFIVRSNTGTTLFVANTTGIDVANSFASSSITSDKILTVANTKISGNIISSQITSVANTQITGNIASSQITSNPTFYGNVSVTGVIGVGGATPTSNGSGISFPATQSASSDANTLDDYEEGTFTPSITFGGGSTGITYGSRVGLYRKVGSLVVAQVFVTLSNKGSSTGPSNVAGFPFTSTSVSNAYCAATMWASNLTNTGMIYSYIAPSGTVVQLQQLSTAGVNANLTETNFANNTEIMVTVSYQTS